MPPLQSNGLKGMEQRELFPLQKREVAPLQSTGLKAMEKRDLELNLSTAHRGMEHQVHVCQSQCRRRQTLATQAMRGT